MSSFGRLRSQTSHQKSVHFDEDELQQKLKEGTNELKQIILDGRIPVFGYPLLNFGSPREDRYGKVWHLIKSSAQKNDQLQFREFVDSRQDEIEKEKKLYKDFQKGADLKNRFIYRKKSEDYIGNNTQHKYKRQGLKIFKDNNTVKEFVKKVKDVEEPTLNLNDELSRDASSPLLEHAQNIRNTFIESPFKKRATNSPKKLSPSRKLGSLNFTQSVINQIPQSQQSSRNRFNHDYKKSVDTCRIMASDGFQPLYSQPKCYRRTLFNNLSSHFPEDQSFAARKDLGSLKAKMNHELTQSSIYQDKNQISEQKQHLKVKYGNLKTNTGRVKNRIISIDKVHVEGINKTENNLNTSENKDFKDLNLSTQKNSYYENRISYLRQKVGKSQTNQKFIDHRGNSIKVAEELKQKIVKQIKKSKGLRSFINQVTKELGSRGYNHSMAKN